MTAGAQFKPFYPSIPAIEIRSAVPVVRLAKLRLYDPVLTLKQAKEASVLIKEAWLSGLAAKYLAKAAMVFGIPESHLTFTKKEVVRFRMDGKTPMIDLPRVRTLDNVKVKFDQRSCVALCTDDSTEDKFSSKVWTRVGPPQFDLGCSLDEIRERTRLYRHQASICCEWFYEQFLSLTEDLFKNNSSADTGRLEVTTLGLQVAGELDEDSFDDWLLSNDGPNSDNDDLFRFLGDAADVDADLRDAEPDYDWKLIPNTVELPNRDLASRQFVYLVRKTNDEYSVVGIGFDDSGRGELASDVALKISRVIANRI